MDGGKRGRENPRLGQPDRLWDYHPNKENTKKLFGGRLMSIKAAHDTLDVTG